MTRAAIYARMSTDKQSEASPADQVRECRRFAERRGFEVVPELVFEEAGVSGASRHNRPRLLELIARIDEWDALLCFDFSRLARNQEDLGWVTNRLRLHRRQAFEASTGLDLKNIGARVMGVVNEEYLAKLAEDTRRGLRGRAEGGLLAAGLPYGYRSEPAGVGERSGRRLVVDSLRAEHVRRIFDLYLKGCGYREIADALNRDGIPPPKPRTRSVGAASWAPSAIREILRNPLYRGESIYNRSEWVKDHETGRRRRFERPEHDWIRRTDERWRIVSNETWAAVQERLGRKGLARRQPLARPMRRGPEKHALGGLLRCGTCGGSFCCVTGRELFGCSWHRDRGPSVCASTLRIPRRTLEARVIGGLRELLSPDRVRRVVGLAIDELKRDEHLDAAAPLQARLAGVDRELENVVDLAATHGTSDVVRRKLDRLESERGALAADLAQIPPAPPPADWIAVRTEAEALLGDLPALVGEAGPAETRAALREYLGGERLTVRPDAERGFRVEGLIVLPWPRTERAARNPEGLRAAHPKVAGAGFEPATCGL